jgi:hypothetical protein
MRVGVVGVGLMGAMAVQLARRAGVRDVIAVDVCEARAAMARAMGATNATKDAAEARRCAGYGVDVAIDAAGTGEARRLALELSRPGGTAVLLGMAEKKSELDFGAAIRREVFVRTSFGYVRRDFGEAVDLLTAGAVDLSPWTKVAPMEDAQRAFEMAAEKEGELVKVVIEKRGTGDNGTGNVELVTEVGMGGERAESSNLFFAESATAIGENVARFNLACGQHIKRAVSLVRQCKYWIYDEASGKFAPSKFSAYEGMDFLRYERAVAGKTSQAHFDGASARKRIEEILEKKFVREDVLTSLLVEWVESFGGPGVLDGIQIEKWHFARL